MLSRESYGAIQDAFKAHVVNRGQVFMLTADQDLLDMGLRDSVTRHERRVVLKAIAEWSAAHKYNRGNSEGWTTDERAPPSHNHSHNFAKPA